MLVYFAISLITLMGFCGLAVDVGRVELRQVQLQAAADAGALSAAAEYQHKNSSWANAATTEVNANAALNGYPNPTVAVQQFASFGAYAADNSTFQVTVTQTVNTIFLGLLGSASRNATISARGVAMIPPCVFLMGNPTISNTSQDLWLASTGINNLPCPTYAKDGYTVDGFAHICCTTPKTAGPASSSGIYGWTYPAVQYTSPAYADPLAYVVAPTFSSCTYTNMNYTSSATISPGTYCGTLKASGAGTVLTMQPGLYIITGGVQFHGVNSSSVVTINGTGVTLYLTKGGGSGFGRFDAHYAALNISAPSDASGGGIPGVVLMGDRSWVGGNQDFSWDYAPQYGDGIIYTTGTGIYNWASNMSGPNYFTIVTANMYLYLGALKPFANYGQLPGGDPLRLPIVLVQ